MLCILTRDYLYSNGRKNLHSLVVWVDGVHPWGQAWAQPLWVAVCRQRADIVPLLPNTSIFELSKASTIYDGMRFRWYVCGDILKDRSTPPCCHKR